MSDEECDHCGAKAHHFIKGKPTCPTCMFIIWVTGREPGQAPS